MSIKWFLAVPLLCASSWAQLANTVPTLPTGITTPDGFSTYIGTVFDTEFPSVSTDIALHGGGGSALQTAISALLPNQRLLVDPGTYQAVADGGFTLPCITSNPSNLWTVIESSGAIPAEHNRIDPSYEAQMVQMIGKHHAVNSNSQCIFIHDLNSTHSCVGRFRLVGIDCFVDSGSDATYTNGTSGPPVIHNAFSFVNVQVSNSSYVVFDRVRVHGNDDFAESDINNPGNKQDIVHCFAIGDNSELSEPGNDHIAIIDSYIDQCHAAASNGGDTQGILFAASPGPFKLVNTFVSSTGENFMTGGAGGLTNTRHPADVESQGNHFYVDPALRTNYLTVASTALYNLKTNREFKDCNRCLENGNVYENNWATLNFNEHGDNLRMLPAPSQSGNGAVTNNLTITNTVFLGANVGAIVGGFDANCNFVAGCTGPGQADKVLFKNNAMQTEDQSLLGGNNLGAWEFQMGFNVTNLQINYNTAFTTGTQGVVGQNADASFRWTLAGNSQANAQDTQPFALLNAAGSGYSNNDTLTINSPCSSATQMTVLTVDGSGHILTYQPANGGFGGSFGCSNATLGVTGGTGTGATFTVVMTNSTNKWLMNNVLPNEPNSDTNVCRGGLTPPDMLSACLALPTGSGQDPTDRFKYNDMFICAGCLSAHVYPATNITDATLAHFDFVNPSIFNYELVTPVAGSDGPIGINFNTLCQATAKTIAGTVAGTVSCPGTSGNVGFNGVTLQGVTIQ